MLAKATDYESVFQSNRWGPQGRGPHHFLGRCAVIAENMPYKKWKDRVFICTTLSSLHGRNPDTGEPRVRYQITAYWLTPKEWLKEKAFHYLICEGLERIVPRFIRNWYVPGRWVGLQPKGIFGYKAPLDVWTDMHCPANTGAFRKGKALGHIDISKEQYSKLSCFTEPKRNGETDESAQEQARPDARATDRKDSEEEPGRQSP